MDLGNASPLCQEGKDLIELDEKKNTVKLHFQSCLEVYIRMRHLVFILGVTLEPQFKRSPQFT